MPNIKLASKRCKTCIFNNKSPFDIEEFRRTRWVNKEHQVCHQFFVEGQRRFDKSGNDRHVWCRGFWDSEIPDNEKQLLENIGLVEVIPQK